MNGPVDFAAKLRAVLAEADAQFTKTRDPMDALPWVALAAKSGVPLPPRMGQWLHRVLQDYIGGIGTMDAAMGLALRGQEQPRRKRRTAAETDAALGRMWLLVKAGANRTQAATLVAALTGRSVEQLSRSYGASGFARRTDDPFAGVPAGMVREYVVGMLAEYPESTQTEQEKAAILRRHPAPPAF